MTINPSLEVISALCRELGEPQTRYASVQVVGSNGKTSTARLIEAFLRVEGIRTGLTTSPALSDERERIQIDGMPLQPDQWEETRQRVESAVHSARAHTASLPQPSDFELVTALAFEAFATSCVDIAVVEAGIGGTWDSTCILNPAVVVITSVSLEHTALLGDTIEAIARDKAGAIKPGSTVVLSDGVTDETARAIMMQTAQERGAVVLTEPMDRSQRAFVANLTAPTPDAQIILGHIPAYQYPNIKSAIIATEAVLGRALARKTVAGVLESMTFPGRFDVLARAEDGTIHVLFDGAHNPEAASRLAEAVSDALRTGRLTEKPVVALGVFDDKDLGGIISALDPIASAFLALRAGDPDRAVAPDTIQEMVASHAQSPGIDRWNGDQPLLVTGSLSLFETAMHFASLPS